MKIFYLSLIFSISTVQPNLFANSSEIEIEKMTRGLEIRYIVDHPADQNSITVDGIKYLVFGSKKEAILHVENMSVKKDFTIVYVRTDVAQDSEIVEIN